MSGKKLRWKRKKKTALVEAQINIAVPQESAQEVADQVVKLVSSLSFEDLALLVKVVENPIYKTKALAELRKHMG